MDDLRFDYLVRSLAAPTHRRAALAALLSTGLVGFTRSTASPKGRRHGTTASKSRGGQAESGGSLVGKALGESCHKHHGDKCAGNARCHGGRCRCAHHHKPCSGHCIPEDACCHGGACDTNSDCCPCELCSLGSCFLHEGNDARACPGGVCCGGVCRTGVECCTDVNCGGSDVYTCEAGVCHCHGGAWYACKGSDATCVACGVGEVCREEGQRGCESCASQPQLPAVCDGDFQNQQCGPRCTCQGVPGRDGNFCIGDKGCTGGTDEPVCQTDADCEVFSGPGSLCVTAPCFGPGGMGCPGATACLAPCTDRAKDMLAAAQANNPRMKIFFPNAGSGPQWSSP